MRNHPDFGLYNLSSLEISTTNLQQAPCLIQTLDITHRPAWELSIAFWRSVQYRGIPGIRCFQTAFATLEQLTISQHGSSSPDRLWLRILIAPQAVSLPLRQSILNVLAVERATMSSAANHIIATERVSLKEAAYFWSVPEDGAAVCLISNVMV